MPIPYPNTGGSKPPSAEKLYTQPKVPKGVPSVSTGLPSTTGKRPGAFRPGSAAVKVEGKSAAHVTSMTGHNGSSANMPGGLKVAPSQTKVKVAP